MEYVHRYEVLPGALLSVAPTPSEAGEAPELELNDGAVLFATSIIRGYGESRLRIS